MDQVDKIIAFEQGDLDREQIIALFQELLDSGLVFKLQGSYGRMATQLLEYGLIEKKVA